MDRLRGAPFRPSPRGMLRAAAAALPALTGVPAKVRAAAPGSEAVDAASRTLLLVATLLAVVILLPVAFLVWRRFFGAVRGAPAAAAPPADPLAEAEAEEQRGNFAAAAARFDAAGDKLRAAACWEKAREYPRAAESYEAAGDLAQAAALHLRSGGSLRAAGIYMRMKDYMEAAQIFRNKGDHLRAAQALELFGNAVAAAREYSAAGNHARAARLLEEEGMYAEAAAAYHPLLADAEVTARTAAQHAAHAALLALAGERERAIAAYRAILAAVPENQRAASGLQALLARAAAPGAEAAAGGRPAPVGIVAPDTDLGFVEPAEPLPAGHAGAHLFTLRSMIHAGRMEPRYSMRLWVQAMRALAEHHAAGVVFGSLTPESVAVDMENNVRIEAAPDRRPPYAAPEVLAGRPPERAADLYSMGVILFELVTGGTGDFGRRRAGELVPEVPDWLDELIGRCTQPELARRFRSTEEVSAALLKLKNAAAE